ATPTNTFDYLSLAGIVELCKLRETAQYTGTGWTAIHGVLDSEVGEPVHIIQAPEPAVQLYTQFCSQPVPKTITHEIRPGVFETALELNGVGQANAVSYFVRSLIRQADDLTPQRWEMFGVTRVPVETRVLD